MAMLLTLPLYHRGIAEPMRILLSLVKKANLEGELAGAFGSHMHSRDTSGLVLDTMGCVYRMKPIELRPFNTKEAGPDMKEGLRACQDYGKVFVQKLGA